MGKVKEGGKAGLLAGLIYAAMEAAVVVTLLTSFRSIIIKVISSELPSRTAADVNAVYNSLVGVDAAIAVVFGIIAGLVLGLVFGAVSDRIPGQRGVAKGLVFGFGLWLILHVIADYFGNLKYGVTFYLVDIALGLVTSLAYGALLGFFFEREMKKLASLGPSEIAGEEEGPTQRNHAKPPQQTTSTGAGRNASNPENEA